ncbi:hypothetical protein KVF89_09960 [Nocardioides carbamazepini]|uniref:hypothetical protein n=1 Tax=Nocardioides carbamazepini TaxID=2854259 RepID=UPI002149D3DD|nr:hypothetical protein [Nocardioides carbamazepini]MCR1782857.1 hypothetical protein [Nocardioides carbamazepini]
MAPPQWQQYSPDDTPDPDASPTPPAYQPPKPPKRVRSVAERTVRTGGGSSVGLAVGGVAAVAGATALIFALAGGSDPPGADAPQTDAGFDALVAALEEETGSTQVRSVVIYPEYAVVDAPYKPEDPSDERELSFYWDGELDEPSKGTGDEEPFDLATVDSAVLDGLCPQVEQLVEDPDGCYLIIERPDAEDETPAWVSAYASNEFNQTAYVEFGLDGAVVEVHPAT